MSTPLRLLIVGLAVLAGLAALPATACTATPNILISRGPYSPQALKTANIVPQMQARAGLKCPTSVIVILGDNYVRGKFKSDNGLKLSNGEAALSTIGYVASLDAAGNYPYRQNEPIEFMQNNLLNVLGLLGGTDADIPIYIKLTTATALLPDGTYTDKITIDWSWKICSLLGLGDSCVGTLVQGTGQTIITVTVTVVTQNVVTTVTSSTTWDTANGISNPKAIPGSKQRVRVAIANPDLVPLDNGSVKIVVPTPAGAAIALDGDGASLGAVIRGTEGARPSSLTLTYSAPDNPNDDIDFSSDNGVNWDYYPTAGNLASEAAVTHIRLRPKGVMAKQSNYSVSIPYRVK